MGVVEIRRLKQLEEENAKLKRLVADLSLDKSMLQDVHRKNVWSAPSVQGSGSSQRYRSKRDPQTALRIRIKDLAAARVRYGYRRLHVLLRREGWSVNHKRVYRLYSEEGLSIRTKLPRRKRAWRYRAGRPEIVAPNDV